MQTLVQTPGALVGIVCPRDPSPDWFPTWGGQFHLLKVQMDVSTLQMFQNLEQEIQN